MTKWKEFTVIPLAIVFIAVLILIGQPEFSPPALQPPPASGSMPDFASYKDVRAKKKAFFEFLLPMIRNANAAVREERSDAKGMLNKITGGKPLTAADKSMLTSLFAKYELDVPQAFTAGKVQKLLTRVDTVPASLVLAQAANESAWGTSRFARQANNFFGIWCFTPGCGVTPIRRDAGKTHEVRRYDSVQAGVNHYIRMINTSGAYRELRNIRAALRDDNNVSGLGLAEGLLRYSERGPAYVRELKQMIRYNNLHQYTLDYSA